MRNEKTTGRERKGGREMAKYFTVYGNVCNYREGAKTAYDVDMGERIPADMVDLNTKGLKNDPLKKGEES